MGEGIKLPEDERPPINEILQRLDARISKKYQSIFVCDVQNDCTCSTESYDKDPLDVIVHTFLDSVEEINYGDRIRLPMQEDLSEKDLIKLLDIACQKASGSELNDLKWMHMLYNPINYSKDLIDIFEKYCYSISINRGGDIHGWHPFDFVPEGYVYFLPEPEHFGAISVNIDKFGAFCFPKNIMKKKIKED